jgi:hypothetical protein
MPWQVGQRSGFQACLRREYLPPEIPLRSMYPVRFYRPISSSISLARLLTSYSIGDWYPERNFFQYLIAVNSGESFRAVCPSRD